MVKWPTKFVPRWNLKVLAAGSLTGISYPRRALKLLKVRCQWMDAFTPPLEKHIESLVKIVSRHPGLGPAIPIEKEKKNEPPGADQVQSAAKEIKPVKENKKEEPDMPEDVKKVISKALKVDKNENEYWEACYQEGIVMVYVPPGEFMMGQTDEEKKWLIDQIGEKDYNSYYKNETPFIKFTWMAIGLVNMRLPLLNTINIVMRLREKNRKIETGVGKTGRLFMFPGPKPVHTANGYPIKSAFNSNCPPKRSGKRLPAGTTNVNIPGAAVNRVKI
jgi:hypothetical protein